jgi:hypothetical protein
MAEFVDSLREWARRRMLVNSMKKHPSSTTAVVRDLHSFSAAQVAEVA